MNGGELYGHFRSQIDDVAKPYLWSDAEAWRYAVDAQRMFVRLTGGIADFTSDATKIKVKADVNYAAMHPSILRVMSAYRASDKAKVEVLNQTDLVSSVSNSDYGTLMMNINDPQPGSVAHMILGAQRNTAKFAVLPSADDLIQMSIYRLPLAPAAAAADEIDEIDEEHHIHLVLWMKHLAYAKQDVETYDAQKSEKYKKDFEEYCSKAKSEQERKKHKTRVVSYGGI